MNKIEIRKRAISQRSNINPSDHEIYSERVCNQVLNFLYQFNFENKNVGIFYPFNNEIDINLVLKKSFDKFNFLYPRVIGKEEPLSFAPFKKNFSDLKKGFGGILEPTQNIVDDLEVLIVSCSAFNLNGFRVGYGGGFYDRTISKMKALNEKLSVMLVAFECQKTSHQFQENFDQKVDIICTEKRLSKL